MPGEMHIVVCAKQVPNPDAAFSMFRVDEAARRIVAAPGLQLVMSPFDEQAVEAALRIRDRGREVKITVLTLGPESARGVIKHALAMGADEGVLVDDSVFESADSYVTAHALAAAIRKLGGCDLVLAGRQAADDDAGVVGAGVGELLGFAVIGFASNIEVDGAIVRVERVVDDGSEIVEAEMPALVTVSNELGAARTPSLRETMRAARKPIALWQAAALGTSVNGAAQAQRAVERVFVPLKENRCEFMAGSAAEQAAGLAERLYAAKLI